MTDDEINDLIIEHHANSGEVNDVIAFARAIESRTLTNQKARWYQEGVEAEREACAAIVDAEIDEWESKDICAILRQIVVDIRARGER